MKKKIKMNTIESNKLIAEFMGYEIFYRPYSNGFIKLSETELCDVDDLKYHTDWNELHKVIDKIECTSVDNEDNSDNFFNVMIEVFECNINGGDISICKSGNTKREATYNTIIEFILNAINK